jgi:hypothetical protein
LIRIAVAGLLIIALESPVASINTPARFDVLAGVESTAGYPVAGMFSRRDSLTGIFRLEVRGG